MVEPMALVADGTEVGGADLTDEELTDLALSASPEQPLDPGAVPLALYSSESPGFLPMWYMPPVVARAAGGGGVRSCSCLSPPFWLLTASACVSPTGSWSPPEARVLRQLEELFPVRRGTPTMHRRPRVTMPRDLAMSHLFR